jgi:hypothetical protein
MQKMSDSQCLDARIRARKAVLDNVASFHRFWHEKRYRAMGDEKLSLPEYLSACVQDVEVFLSLEWQRDLEARIESSQRLEAEFNRASAI